jgi:acetylglutamate kinase
LNHVIVLKVGGSLQGRHLDVVVQSVQQAHRLGFPVVVVHGGGPAITAALAAHGIELPFRAGQRVTPPEAVHIVDHVLTREVNPAIVRALTQAGIEATGLSGACGILYARSISGLERTGEIVRVDPYSLHAVLHNGVVPVVSPVASDETGNLYNVNADLAASAVAVSLMARKFVLFTDVPGIFANWNTKARLAEATADQLRQLLQANVFHSGMIPKVQSVLQALGGGVEQVYVLQGNAPETAARAVDHELNEPWTDPLGTYISNTLETMYNA